MPPLCLRWAGRCQVGLDLAQQLTDQHTRCQQRTPLLSAVTSLLIPAGPTSAPVCPGLASPTHEITVRHQAVNAWMTSPDVTTSAWRGKMRWVRKLWTSAS